MHLHPSARWFGGLIACAALALPASASALSPGDLVVVDYLGAAVTVVDPTTGVRTSLSSNTAPAGGPAFVHPVDAGFEADGNLVVLDESGAVIRVDATTGARTLVSANGSPAGGPDFVQPDGTAVEAGGGILVVDQRAFGGMGGVIRVDPVTGARTTVSSNGAPIGGPSFGGPFGMALESDGDIVVANTGANAIIRVNPVSGVRTLVSSNSAPAGAPPLDGPFDVDIDAAGAILVLNQSSADLLRVDPVTGARTTVSANTAPAGAPQFAFPDGVAVEASGCIVVADVSAFSGGGLIRVNPATGARSTISENATPPGNPLFSAPARVAVVPGSAPVGCATGVLADHPRGYWRFAEPSGTALLDSSGNNNNGTYLGGVALGAAGIPGAAPDTAATFDGVNDTGRVPDSASLDVGGSFSVEGWIKRTATTKSQELFNRGSSGIQLTVMSAGSGNQVWLRKAGVTTIAHSAGGVPADGAYHHVVATMNGPGTAKIYIDGVLDTVSVSAAQAIADTAFPLTFGIAASNPTLYDEFALYDDPLSASTVAAHHAAGA